MIMWRHVLGFCRHKTYSIWEFKLIQFLHNKSPDTLVVTHVLNLATSTYIEAFVFKRHTILLLDFRLTNCRLALGIPWDF